MTRLQIRSLLALALLTSACGDSSEPLDGGYPLRFDKDPKAVELLRDDPCWRQEKGGWHLGIGHCKAMTSAEPMSGVLVLAYEESSFFPGDTGIPDSRDLRRFITDTEADFESVYRKSDVMPSSPGGDAYLLSFIGRRTRDPNVVDCQGRPWHTFVVDRLLSARYLGPMAPLPVGELSGESRPVTVAVRHGGAWGEEEKKAIKNCGRTGT